MQSDQRLIQLNFDQAAHTYFHSAQIQTTAARKIMKQLACHYAKGIVLDLGSGPGTILHEGCHNAYSTILYDLSLNMLKIGTRIHTKLAVNGTATQLPFATSSIPAVISNLMLQWPNNKVQALCEVERVLKPNGVFIFTTLIQPSLWQLQKAWRKIDMMAHTLEFLMTKDYLNLCQQVKLDIVSINSWEEQFYFHNILELVKHFKLTGTSLPKTNSNKGLAGRQVFQKLELAYSEFKTKQGLPLNYKYLIIVAKKC